nr:hypothetical protein [Tanacetum cinerariifolium]
MRCVKNHIPATIHPQLPNPNHSIRDSPAGKIGVNTRCLLSPPLRSLILRSYAVFIVLFQSLGFFAGFKLILRIKGVNIIAEEEVEETIADKPKGFRKKRKVAGGASGSNLPPTKVREDHGTSGVSTGWSLLLRFRAEAQYFGCSNATDAEVSFAVRSFVSDPSIMTTTVATMVVSDTSFIPMNRAGDELVHTSVFADSTSIGMVYVPKWNIVNEFALDDPDVCRSLVDQLAPPVLFSSFVERDVEIGNLKAQLSLKEAEAAEAIHVRGQVSVAEAAKAARVSELDRLKVRNLVLEGEKSTLDGQVAALESLASAKEAECASLSSQTAKLTQDLSNLQLSFDELNVKAASLEHQKDNLASQVSSLDATCAGLREQISGYDFSKEQYKAVQDEQVKILSDKVAGLDAELMGMDLHFDKELYPCFLTTIAGRRWILSRSLKLVVT